MSAGRQHARDLVRLCGLATVRAVFERDPDRVERLFFEPRLKPAAAGFCRQLAQTHKPYREVPPEELARVAGTPHSGGIVAVARPQAVAEFDPAEAAIWARDGRLLVVLDGVGNPHNLGAIARSAAFFGAARLLLAERPEQALPSDASYRVAEGGLEHLALYRARLGEALPALRPHYRLLAAVAEGGAPPRTGTRPAALVLGNEETGPDPATLSLCDARVTIPGAGHVQSLNVATAAAVLCYALSPAVAIASSGERLAVSAEAAASSSSAASASAAASSVDRASRRGSRRSRA
jgi:RNA methyltransferase, TrmH family